MKRFLFFLALSFNSVCQADLFDVEPQKLCDLLNNYGIITSKFYQKKETHYNYCSDNNQEKDIYKKTYIYTYGVTGHFELKNLADHLFLKVEGLSSKIYEPEVREEYIAMLHTILSAITSNEKLEEFVNVVRHLKPNQAAAINLDALNIKVGYRVYNWGTSFYRLDISNQCQFDPKDKLDRERCLERRSKQNAKIEIN